MPKKRWSANDERKYKAIVHSCKRSRGRKKGVTKICKRIAAATVERDRGMESLGLRGLRSIPARGMGAQLLSINIDDVEHLENPQVPLRGTRAQHRAEANHLLDSAERLQREGMPSSIVDTALVRAGQEARWISKTDREKDSARALRIHDARFDGLGCACSSSPTTAPLAGRKRKKRK